MVFPFDYLFVSFVILIINIIPAFMPPTWIILAFFFIQFHLMLIPTVLIGAVMATAGRVILALLVRKYGSKVLPKTLLKNYHTLGVFFEKNQKLTIPVILMYAFSPISSNQVYIIAGLSQISLKVIAFSFLIGRLISYSFWVNLSYHFSKTLEGLFIRHITDYRSLLIEMFGLIVILLVGLTDWERILKIKKNNID